MASIKKPLRGNSPSVGEDHIVRIPYDQLSPDTLRAVIEEFVTRDGTDYGEIEVPLEQKVRQVYKELRSGKALILFDTGDQTCNIFAKEDPAIKDVMDKD